MVPRITVQSCSSMALTFLVSLSMFSTLGLAQNNVSPVPNRLIDVQKYCWASLKTIEGCVVEINRSILAGKFHALGPACCKAFVWIDEACWPKMFPLDPFFPPLVQSHCAAQSKGSTAPPVVESSTALASPPTMQESDVVELTGLVDEKKCWTSLHGIEGCGVEIFKSFFSGKIKPPGPVCCMAIVAVNDACWPKMFPLNPFFPPLLKSYCARGGSAAPAPVSRAAF